MKLYHYTSIESFWKIWLSQELQFCEYKNVNDLFEKFRFVQIDFRKGFIAPQNKAYEKEGLLYFFNSFRGVLKEYRQISFCLDTKQGIRGCLLPMMWGQYARNEKGVCIEVDSKRLPKDDTIFHDKITYSENIKYINLNSTVLSSNENTRIFIENNCKDIFFTKHSNWKQEYEYRIISRIHDALSIKDAITCVYVMADSSLETELVVKLVEGKVPIKCIDIDSSNNEYVKLTTRNIEDIKNEQMIEAEIMKIENQVL